eukprot:1609066-Ditylum_brightwellii.AAC.1
MYAHSSPLYILTTSSEVAPFPFPATAATIDPVPFVPGMGKSCLMQYFLKYVPQEFLLGFCPHFGNQLPLF